MPKAMRFAVKGEGQSLRQTSIIFYRVDSAINFLRHHEKCLISLSLFCISCLEFSVSC